MRRHQYQFKWLVPPAALALAMAAALATPAPARAQDGSDAALDALIKEIGEGDEAQEPKTAEKADQPKPKETKKAEEPKKPKPAELSGKDKELDDLLQSLGETKDEPEAKDERKPPGQPDGGKKDDGAGRADQDKQEKKDQADPGDDRSKLDARDKAIDEELEELAGRHRKKKGEGDDDDGQGSGPMREIVKEMRDIEKRLGEPDTGEETRDRQQQLVKRLETLIEQIRKEQQEQRNRRMQLVTRRQGDQEGQQEGQQTGNNPGGAPNQRPRKPTDNHLLAGGKDAWGHLPPELRQEMENVAKEESLPLSEDLIRRYYLSVSRGKLNRGE